MQVGARLIGETGRHEASTSRRHFGSDALDQLQRGGQDAHRSQRDCGEAGGREGSAGRRHGGCFEVLKPAHRDTRGLFQPVDVGNPQSHSSLAEQQTAIENVMRSGVWENSIGLYGEQVVKAGRPISIPQPPLARLLSVQSVSKLPRGTTRRYSRRSPVISSVAVPFNDAGTTRSSATLPKRFSLG
jgi:hypothetical protein